METQDAFDTKTIVQTHATSLRLHLVAEACAITVAGRLYVRDASDIRYNPETNNGEIRIWGEWIALTEQGVALWATRERLNWQMPSGRVLHPDEPLYPAETAGA